MLKNIIVRTTTIVLLTVVVLGSQAAIAQDYYPLDISNEWYYENDYGQPEHHTIIDQIELLGNTVFVRHQLRPDDESETYWSLSGEGDVFLHGSRNYDGTFEVAFLPPLKMVESPLNLGDYWVTEGVQMYDLDGNLLPVTPPGLSCSVVTAEDLDVPAGTFFSYSILYGENKGGYGLLGRDDYDILGRRIDCTSKDPDVSDWWVEDIGPVWLNCGLGDGCAYKLVWYTTTTESESATWSSVKSLFK